MDGTWNANLNFDSLSAIQKQFIKFERERERELPKSEMKRSASVRLTSPIEFLANGRLLLKRFHSSNGRNSDQSKSQITKRFVGVDMRIYALQQYGHSDLSAPKESRSLGKRLPTEGTSFSVECLDTV